MNKKMIAIAYNFVGEVMVSILIGFLIGRWLDGLLNTTPLFLISFLLIGIFTSLFLLVRRVNRLEDKKDDE